MAVNTGVQAVGTTLEILTVLQERNGGRVAEIASETDIANSTAHRHLSTLTENGFVVKQGDEYHLSGRVLHFGETVRKRRPEFSLIKQKVDELANETGEVVQFAVEEHGYGLAIFRALGEHAVTTDLSLGQRTHLTHSAVGKAILAFLPEERIDAIIKSPGLPDATENTITDREELEGELAEIRKRGVSFNTEERIQGLCAVGAPIMSPHQQVLGGISIAGPKNRLQGETFQENLPKLLRGNVNELEINLAYSSN